jgi:hypothetical protein
MSPYFKIRRIVSPSPMGLEADRHWPLLHLAAEP